MWKVSLRPKARKLISFRTRGISIADLISTLGPDTDRLVMKAKLFALCITTLTVLAAPPGWHSDFARAQGFARKTHKPMLLNFTGSDWCSWCKRMKLETLNQKEFISYASTNLLLVELDFPNSIPQSQAERTANEALKLRYKVEGFPTFVFVDAEGVEWGRHTGYLKGGVPAFTKQLDDWRTKSAESTSTK